MARHERRSEIVRFKHEVRTGLVTHLVDADEPLDQHPLLSQARRYWRSNIGKRRPYCCACKTGFANGAAIGAHLFIQPDGAATLCSVSAFCVTCWRDLSDSEISRAAERVVQRVKPGFRFSEPPL